MATWLFVTLVVIWLFGIWLATSDEKDVGYFGKGVAVVIPIIFVCCYLTEIGEFFRLLGNGIYKVFVFLLQIACVFCATYLACRIAYYIAYHIAYHSDRD